jgi:hypothetical protein
MYDTTISEVFEDLHAKGVFHLQQDAIENYMRSNYSMHKNLLMIANFPQQVASTAYHKHHFELAYGLLHVPDSEKEEAGLWLNEKLAPFEKLLRQVHGESPYLIQKVVDRRLEFSNVSLHEAFITVICEGFLANPNEFLERIQFRPRCVDYELEHVFEEYHRILILYCVGCEYSGLEEYQARSKLAFRHLRHVSDEIDEIWTMSNDETLTIACLYNFLHKFGYFGLSLKEKKNLIRACIDSEKHSAMAWLRCMTLPRKIAMKAEHQWADEISIFHGRKSIQPATKWLCSKLHTYVRVHEGRYTLPIFSSISRVVEERAHYDHISLNDAIIEMDFKCEDVEYFNPCNKRQTDVFSLGMLKMYLDNFQKEFSAESRRRLGVHAGNHPRLEMLQYHVERFEEEIKRREIELGPFNAVERFQMNAILRRKSMRIDAKAHAEFNDCIIIEMNGEKRLLSKSNIEPLRSFLKPSTHQVPGTVNIHLEKQRFRCENKEAIEQLFEFTSNEIDTCGICLDEKKSSGCGNRCSWRGCWSCFHEWFSKNSNCPICARSYIPLADRKYAV